MKLMIVGTRSRTTYLIVNDLAARFDVAAVLFEEKRTGKMLRYRLRTLGWPTVVAQLVFLAYDRVVIRPRSRAKIDVLLADYDTSAPDARLSVTDVVSLNSAPAWDILREHAPDMVIVSGAGILGKTILGLAPTFINLHVGITPRYRGVHGGYWAIYEGRPELAGVTVHHVDAGIDTGAILGQAVIDVSRDDTYRTLPVKQALAGLPLLAQAVEGKLTPHTRDDLESKLWYSPTPWQHTRFVRKLLAQH